MQYETNKILLQNCRTSARAYLQYTLTYLLLSCDTGESNF